jgi:riboflavin synthase alpha subunit
MWVDRRNDELKLEEGRLIWGGFFKSLQKKENKQYINETMPNGTLFYCLPQGIIGTSLTITHVKYIKICKTLSSPN